MPSSVESEATAVAPRSSRGALRPLSLERAFENAPGTEENGAGSAVSGSGGGDDNKPSPPPAGAYSAALERARSRNAVNAKNRLLSPNVNAELGRRRQLRPSPSGARLVEDPTSAGSGDTVRSLAAIDDMNVGSDAPVAQPFVQSRLRPPTKLQGGSTALPPITSSTSKEALPPLRTHKSSPPLPLPAQPPIARSRPASAH